MNHQQNISKEEKSPLVSKIYELMHCLETIKDDPKVDTLCELKDWKLLLINFATFDNEEERNYIPEMTTTISKILSRLPIIENHLNNRLDVTEITKELKTLFKNKLDNLLLTKEVTSNKPAL